MSSLPELDDYSSEPVDLGSLPGDILLKIIEAGVSDPKEHDQINYMISKFRLAFPRLSTTLGGHVSSLQLSNLPKNPKPLGTTFPNVKSVDIRNVKLMDFQIAFFTSEPPKYLEQLRLNCTRLSENGAGHWGLHSFVHRAN